jgi:hypothetical protein
VTVGRDREQVAFESELYAELRPLMFSIAHRMLGSVSEADDVVQEAFLRFHQALTRETSNCDAFVVIVAGGPTNVNSVCPGGYDPPELPERTTTCATAPAVPGVPLQAYVSPLADVNLAPPLEQLAPAGSTALVTLTPSCPFVPFAPSEPLSPC